MCEFDKPVNIHIQRYIVRLLNIKHAIARASIHTRTDQFMCVLDCTHQLFFNSIITITLLLVKTTEERTSNYLNIEY